MSHDLDTRNNLGEASESGPGGATAGKRTRSEGLTVQRKAAPGTEAVAPTPSGETEAAEDPFAMHLIDAPVQRKITRPTAVQRQATGTSGAAATGAATATGTGAAATGKDAPVAKLHLLVDIDVKELGIAELKNGSVGHTWISLEYLDPHAVPDTVHGDHKDLLATGGKYSDPMGFWPDTAHGVYYNPNPFNSWVQGWMRHPDRAHEGSEKAVQTWTLTQAEVDAVIAYAESKRGAKYSVYFFNCTTFGAEAVKAAGKSPPSVATGGICFPNAAYDGIKARQKKGIGDTTVTDLDTGAESSVQGPDNRKG